MAAKVQGHLASGVWSVRVIEPDLKTVIVYNTHNPATLVTVGQTLTDPEFPGFAAPVADFFL